MCLRACSLARTLEREKHWELCRKEFVGWGLWPEVWDGQHGSAGQMQNPLKPSHRPVGTVSVITDLFDCHSCPYRKQRQDSRASSAEDIRLVWHSLLIMSFGANTPLLTHFAVVTKHSAEFPVGGGKRGKQQKGFMQRDRVCVGGGDLPPEHFWQGAWRARRNGVHWAFCFLLCWCSSCSALSSPVLGHSTAAAPSKASALNVEHPCFLHW